MTTRTLNIDMGKRCAECGKGGATDSGICLDCGLKAMENKPMKSKIGQAFQKRYQTQISNIKRGLAWKR